VLSVCWGFSNFVVDVVVVVARQQDEREQLVIERDSLKSSLQHSEAQRHNALAQLQQYRRLVEEAEAKVAKQPTLTATPVSLDCCVEQVETQSTQSQTDTDTAELDLLRTQLAERDADLKELARQRDEAFQLVR
jgi:multidrug resistance efflux pump